MKLLNAAGVVLMLAMLIIGRQARDAERAAALSVRRHTATPKIARPQARAVARRPVPVEPRGVLTSASLRSPLTPTAAPMQVN